MEANKICMESDEDDYETYFLQPASSPYNIAEKVKEANEILFNQVLLEDAKEFKVKFKENLVDYEPDVTDDDVTSIESYNESVDFSQIHHNEAIALDLHPTKESANINIFETVNEEDDETYEDDIKKDSSNSVSDSTTSKIDENVITKTTDADNLTAVILKEEEDVHSVSSEECQEDIIEEIGEILCGEEVKEKHIFKQKTIDLDVDDDITEISQSSADDVTFKVETNVKDAPPAVLQNNKVNFRKKMAPLRPNVIQRPHIECKNHCIEKLDPGLNLYINKLNIREKPPKDCPALKLQARNCCDKNPVKIEQRLPVYSGHKSEYGLSLNQIERREKLKHATKVRESKQYEILEEFKIRKMQQNEEIFCQWLKDVSRRKREVESVKLQNKKCVTPTLFPFPASKSDPVKSRPLTAQLMPTHVPKKAKRPHTSSACVYIEVPRHILRRGLCVDNVLVDKNRKNDAKKLHILTFS